MAAAYAALMSLLNTSDLVLHPSQQWIRINIIQIESLLQKVRYLQEFLEHYSHRGHQEMAGVESQIEAAAYAAEEIIESHVLKQIPARSMGNEEKSSIGFSQYIHKVIEHMEDLIQNKLMRIKFNFTISKYLSFPLSLKELTLLRCSLSWEDMSIVGSLPNLELLKLWYDACKGKTWCPIQGHFVQLKVLEIVGIDLLHWRADKTHFPILEHLILRKLNLKEFPRDFGEHPTLAKIEVVSCGYSTNGWAEQIGEEQESFGNEGFRVLIRQTEEDKTIIITSVAGYTHTLSKGI